LINQIFRLLRPKQWIKNLLVFAVPILSGEILKPEVFKNSLLLFVAFSFFASAIYVLNDIQDVELDKVHSKKLHRPIASGRVSKKNAILIFAAIFISGSLLMVLNFNLQSNLLIYFYFGIQLLYIFGLKNIPVIELGLVSSGFVIRAISGGVINQIEISKWFLFVVSASSLFVVAGKRVSELLNSNGESMTRPVLKLYPPNFLRMVEVSALTSALIFYALWAAETSAVNSEITSQFSTAIFAVLMFQYAYKIEIGEAEAPEDLVTSDKLFLALAATWIVLMFSHLFGLL